MAPMTEQANDQLCAQGPELGMFSQGHFLGDNAHVGPGEAYVPITRLWNRKPQRTDYTRIPGRNVMTRPTPNNKHTESGSGYVFAVSAPSSRPQEASAFASEDTEEYLSSVDNCSHFLQKGLLQALDGAPNVDTREHWLDQPFATSTQEDPKKAVGWRNAAPPLPHPSSGDTLSHITTLMICDIPCRLTIYQVIDAMNEGGFPNTFDLVYMPPRKGCRPHKQKQRNVGYAFVNFTTPEYAASFANAFHMFSFPSCTSNKLSFTRVAQCQGYQANLKMHSNQLLSGCLLTFQDGVVCDVHRTSKEQEHQAGDAITAFAMRLTL